MVPSKRACKKGHKMKEISFIEWADKGKVEGDCANHNLLIKSPINFTKPL